MIKPPYRIPSMVEINVMLRNGRRVVSTFAGGGGSCLGYRWTGYDVIWANEFEKNQCATHRLNHPETILNNRDIKTITADEILFATGLKSGELDVFDGSPPCQGFSMANQNRLKKVTKVYDNSQSQVNEELFFEYVRILRGLQPKVFVAENVRGLTMGKAKDLLGSFEMDMFKDQSDTILHALMDCGYVVRWQILNAADYGIPQNRLRVFFVGIRRDLRMEPSFPTKLSYQYSVLDALPHLAGDEMCWSDLDGHGTIGIDDSDGAAPTITKCGYKDSGSKTFIKSNTHGKETWRDLNQPHPTIVKGDGKRNNASCYGNDWIGYGVGYKQSPNGTFLRDVMETAELPIRTISKMPSCGGETNVKIIDVEQTRKITIAELKRLGGFPDDFKITGSYSKQWEIIGNSVAPPQMFHLSKHIFENILSKIP